MAAHPYHPGPVVIGTLQRRRRIRNAKEKNTRGNKPVCDSFKTVQIALWMGQMGRSWRTCIIGQGRLLLFSQFFGIRALRLASPYFPNLPPLDVSYFPAISYVCPARPVGLLDRTGVECTAYSTGEL